MSNKDAKRDLIRKIHKDIRNSTIPEELEIIYLMANATELMSTQAFIRLKQVFAKNGYPVSSNDLLTGINQYCRMVKQATYHFFERIEPQICNATYGARKDETGNAVAVSAYDRFNEDTNEICRLVLMYFDRTARNRDGAAKVIATLQQLPSSGLINEEDIAKYKMTGK